MMMVMLCRTRAYRPTFSCPQRQRANPKTPYRTCVRPCRLPRRHHYRASHVRWTVPWFAPCDENLSGRFGLTLEFGGASICQHARQRSRCKECGGGGICQHNRMRHRCKECGGEGICQHARIRSRCKECGGGSICRHARRRSQCKECGGGSICQHNRIRSRCKTCKADKDDAMPPDLEEAKLANLVRFC